MKQYVDIKTVETDQNQKVKLPPPKKDPDMRKKLKKPEVRKIYEVVDGDDLD